MNKQVPISELVPIFKEILDSGSNVNFTPRGVSMLPMLRDNCDTVTLSKPSKLKKYDVVFFYHKPTNSYVLHRIIKVNNDGTYNICGDNRMVCEMNVPKEDIFAVVTAFTKDNKKYSVNNNYYKIYAKKCVLKKKIRWKYYSLKEKLYSHYRKIKRK